MGNAEGTELASKDGATDGANEIEGEVLGLDESVGLSEIVGESVGDGDKDGLIEIVGTLESEMVGLEEIVGTLDGDMDGLEEIVGAIVEIVTSKLWHPSSSFMILTSLK